MKGKIDGRDVLHIIAGFVAIFLEYLTRIEAVLAAVGIFACIYLLMIPSRSKFFNLVARSEDWKRGYAQGLFFYGLAIIFLVIFAPLYIAAVCIVVMSFGDGFATVVGKRYGKTHLSWAKKEKTLEGAIGFLAFATISSFLILKFMLTASTSRLFVYAIITSFIAALVEMLDITVDDNLAVPISSAVVLYILTLISVERLASLNPYLALQFLGICLILGPLTLKFGALDKKGSLAAFVLGLVTYLSVGFRGFIILLTLHVIGAATTRIGIKSKLKRNIAQEKIRSVDNILANGLVSTIGAFLYFAARSNNALFYIGFVGAIAAATADTTSSEIGQLSTKRPRLITTWKEVETGTDGAVSRLGNLSAVGVSIVVALIALIFIMPGIKALPLFISTVIVGFVGTTVDSYLGATLEQEAIIGNNTVNLLATACSFLGAMVIYSAL
ncbi:MAG: DUF92 domain-containing protein [Candidatus Hydrothermarchaeales archaeon]